jgi:hypothetical protein
LAILFVYRSTNVVMRLRPEPPPEFFELRAERNAERREAEERLARAYWDRAVQFVQWRYTYGSSLPDEPPPEFTVDVQGFPGALANAPATRARYWQRIRKVWNLPQAWRKTIAWDTNWLFEGQW